MTINQCMAATLLASIVALTTACQRDSCADFQRMVREPGVAQRLERWVDERAVGGALMSNSTVGRARKPGQYVIPMEFNPTDLGLGAEAEARVVLDSGGRAVAVFFGEESFQGIIVKVGNEATYAVPEKILTRITARVSTVCQKKD